MNERWKEFLLSGNVSCEVSNHGRIRSARTFANGKRRERILKPTCDGRHNWVGTCCGGEPVTKRVHRLVAFHFCDNELKGDVVDHIDGNTKNNHFENLRIVSQQENCLNRKRRNDCGLAHENDRAGWLVQFGGDGKRFKAGRFKTKEEALKRRDEIIMVLDDAMRPGARPTRNVAACLPEEVIPPV